LIPIYSSVPDEAFKEQADFDKRREILIFLKNNKGKLFTARQIAQTVGLPKNTLFF